MSVGTWDAAVIGGGPAGTSAAIEMARRGLKVVLLESKTYPHDKMCGEFLSPECSRLLGSLGLEDEFRQLRPVLIQTVSITAPDGMAWETRLPATAFGLSRRSLDASLAEAARQSGVAVREGETVTGLVGNFKDGFELESAGRVHATALHARVVVGAHGKRGAFDRKLGRRFLEKPQPFMALKAHFHGPPIPSRIELHTFTGGYCGMSEIEGGEKVVCLLVNQNVFQAVGGRGPEGVERFITWMKSQNLYLRSWLQWADRIHERWISIAQVPFLPKPVLERDVLMAGDSASLIVPLAGNGIAMAMESGMLAAEMLAKFLSGELKADDLRRGYPRAWQRRFGLRLRLGRTLQPLLLRPRAASLALKLVDAFPVVGRMLVERTRSPVSPES